VTANFSSRKQYDKKSELVLMRCTRAHSSSRSQVILVYVHPFHLNSLSCSRTLQKLSKNPYFGVEGHLRSLMLIALKSTLPVPVKISSTSVPICKLFHARQANSAKITTLLRGTHIWHPRALASLNVEDWDLDRSNLHSMLKISLAGCLGLSPAISAQFTLEMCITVRNCKEIQ